MQNMAVIKAQGGKQMSLSWIGSGSETTCWTSGDMSQGDMLSTKVLFNQQIPELQV